MLIVKARTNVWGGDRIEAGGKDGENGPAVEVVIQGEDGYKYGGMWKNKHAGVSAKVPKRLKGKLTGKESVESSESVTQSTDGEGSQGDLGSAAGSKKAAKRSKGRMARKGTDVRDDTDGSNGSDGSEGSEGSDGSDGSDASHGDEGSEHGTGVVDDRPLEADTTLDSRATNDMVTTKGIMRKRSQSEANTKAF
ncbi:hypothetical protein B0A48_15287 [Cryoendolithus antarcticus]|uniref:Uncharacterized protein n=1 Tax=Cryoendolithus antarcticus TaxID=1507870 RepID=A0A1V8SJ84_9PEZI|nr:hypothetical protein B0A48_15287 [Cryoendolithus antarcticus]